MYRLVFALLLPVVGNAGLGCGRLVSHQSAGWAGFRGECAGLSGCPKGDLQAASLVWDGARKRVALRAARNEIVSFQVIVERSGRDALSGVNVQVGDLSGPGGARIPQQNVDLFKEWYVHVTRRSAQDYSLGTGWYPDALIPCSHWKGRLFPKSYILPFTIPDLLNNIGPGQQNQAIWVDVYVPRERSQAPPGTYASPITVTSDAGDRVELSLNLGVWDFALPDETHLAGNIHTDTELNTFSPELELRYYQMIRRHRLAMGALGYAPDTTVNGGDIQFDWRSYDARLGRYLDGSAFTEKYGYHGPGYGVPIELLILPFDVYPVNVYYDSRHVGFPYGKEWKFYRPWPVDLPKEGITAEYEAVWTKAFQAFERHFEEHPAWNRTKPIVFLLSLDESYDEPSIEKMLYFGRLLKKSGAKRLKFRMDGSYPMDTMDRLSGVVDISILGVRSYVPERVRRLRARGVEDWFYTGMGKTDGDLLGCRALGWVSWKYQARSWTIWEFDFNSLRAWMYPETYRERNGDVQNGQGFLIYRGETMGLEEPVASVRLKLLRRGSQDYEYFWLLFRQKGGRTRADAIATRVIHEPLGTNGAWGAAGMWSHNAEEWERARIEMGNWIEEGH
jgi:Glycoside hydrolase 123, catalytic domain